MRTFLTVMLTAVAIAGSVVTTAAATPPEKITFFSSFSFEDTTTCPGTTIVQSNEERDTIVGFSNGDLQIQRHGIATLEASGKALTSNFSAKIFVDDAAVKVVGTAYNIQVPGAGNVLLDAGNVVFDASTGAVEHIAGPHQQLTGDVSALCDYLSAP